MVIKESCYRKNVTNFFIVKHLYIFTYAGKMFKIPFFVIPFNSVKVIRIMAEFSKPIFGNSNRNLLHHFIIYCIYYITL